MSASPNSLLAWFDRLLLVGIVTLLLLNRFDARREAEVSRAVMPPFESQSTHAERDEEPKHYVVAASQHTLSFSPEGVTQAHVSRVARTLSHDSWWRDAPVRQAADMREHEGLYQIAFVLSQQIDEKSVLVSTDGNVLSLIASPIGNPNAKVLKQFYIPSSSHQLGPVQTTVSNGIVRVRIQMAP
jgi:hypothetical protein